MQNEYGKDLLMLCGVSAEHVDAFDDAFLDGNQNVVALLKDGYTGLLSTVANKRHVPKFQRMNGAYIIYSAPFENADILAEVSKKQEKAYSQQRF